MKVFSTVSGAAVDNRCKQLYPNEYKWQLDHRGSMAGFNYLSVNKLAVISNANVKSENDCFEQCKFNAPCVAYLWGTPGRCELFQQGSNEKIASGKTYNVYTMTSCPTPPPHVNQKCKTKYANEYSWRISHQGDMSGFQYYQANKLVDLRFVNSVDDCFEQCKFNDPCVGFMWGTAARCSLYQNGHQETELASGKTYDFYTV
eukprot:Pgem_evm1s10852